MPADLTGTIAPPETIASEEQPIQFENLETSSPKNRAVNEPGLDKKATKLDDTMMSVTATAMTTDQAVETIAKATNTAETEVEAAKKKLTSTTEAVNELVASATAKAKETVKAVEKASGPDSNAVDKVTKQEVKKLTEFVKTAEATKVEAKKVAVKEIKKAGAKKDAIVARETERINTVVKKEAVAPAAAAPAPPKPAKKIIKFRPLVVTEDVRQLCLGEVFTDKSKTDTTFALCPVTFDGKCPTVLNASCTQDREIISQVLSRNTKITPI